MLNAATNDLGLRKASFHKGEDDTSAEGSGVRGLRPCRFRYAFAIFYDMIPDSKEE